MVREWLRGKLRALVDAAIVSGSQMDSEVSMVVRDDGGRKRIIILAEPVQYADETLFLVTFKDATAHNGVAAKADTQDSSIVHQLEQDLESSQLELAVTIRNLESSNEELTAANEKAMSMNEEFQSTNEEPETSREELQSFNEELTTLNTQLQQQIDVILPGALTGIDLARQTRRLYPNLKVLLATGYTAKALDVRDAEAVINKPYTMTMLSESLRDILES